MSSDYTRTRYENSVFSHVVEIAGQRFELETQGYWSAVVYDSPGSDDAVTIQSSRYDYPNYDNFELLIRAPGWNYDPYASFCVDARTCPFDLGIWSAAATAPQLNSLFVDQEFFDEDTYESVYEFWGGNIDSMNSWTRSRYSRHGSTRTHSTTERPCPGPSTGRSTSATSPWSRT